MIKGLRLSFSILLFSPLFLPAQKGQKSIEEQFASYREKAFTEKVYLRTDKNSYLTGEVLWWKLYYVDGYYHKLANLSKVVYLEVLDNSNKPVLQAKAAINRDGSNGSFYLPFSLNSGNYTLRAYTNWMKNSGQDYFFKKSLTVINSMKAVPATNAKTPAKYDMQFFPEGGNLVRNIESRVGFRLTDQYGKGQGFSGVLMNENNDTLLQFSPFKFGIGNFVFTPSDNHSYRAVLKLHNGQTLVRNLPEIFQHGYVLKLDDKGSGPIQVTVTTNIPSVHGIFLFAHTRYAIKASINKVVENGAAVFTLDRNNLGDGISHITIFDDHKQPVCERLYFKYPAHSLSITATSTAGQYNVRNKVKLSVQTKTPVGVQPANVSVAVYRVDSLNKPSSDNIQSYLWLSSDLKGSIETPSFYFNAPANETREAINNLMLTHGWRRFDWNTILEDSATITYMPEYDGHIIRGSVINTSTSRPADNIVTYLSIPGSQVQFYPAISDSTKGIVKFDVRDYYGPGEIVLQTDQSSPPGNYRIDINNPFFETAGVGYPIESLIMDKNIAGDLTKASVDMQVQNVYNAEQISKFKLPDIDTLPFYGRHGIVYNLDDYTRFTTMEEILREYVPEVDLRRRNGRLKLLVPDFANKIYFTRDPIILLDGVPVSDEKILGFDPLKIKKLHVLPTNYLLGNFAYGGVVSFSTYYGNVEDLDLAKSTIVLDYEGLQLRREFFSPVYETEQQITSRLPDFRSLLYWSPDVKTDQKGNANIDFYTSDLKGKFIVELEGLDDAGNAGSSSLTFEVNKPAAR